MMSDLGDEGWPKLEISGIGDGDGDVTIVRKHRDGRELQRRVLTRQQWHTLVSSGGAALGDWSRNLRAQLFEAETDDE